MKVQVKLSNEFRQLEKALKRNPKVVRKHLRRASKYIGKKGEALVRNQITNGKYESNAPLTIALKGADEPLKGDGTGASLFKAVTSTVVDDTTVFVGVLRTEDIYNIAIAIHEGKAIPVTKKMRNMFYVLWLKEKDPSVKLEGRAQELWDKMSGGWKPLKASTQAIKIPSRPFISDAMDTGEIQKVAENFWIGALQAAMKEARL